MRGAVLDTCWRHFGAAVSRGGRGICGRSQHPAAGRQGVRSQRLPAPSS